MIINYSSLVSRNSFGGKVGLEPSSGVTAAWSRRFSSAFHCPSLMRGPFSTRPHRPDKFLPRPNFPTPTSLLLLFYSTSSPIESKQLSLRALSLLSWFVQDKYHILGYSLE